MARWDVALASTRTDVWLEPTLAYTSDGRLLVRYSLRRDSGNGKASLAVDGRRGRKTLCSRSVVFFFLFLCFAQRTLLFYSRKCATTASDFAFQHPFLAGASCCVLAPRPRHPTHLCDYCEGGESHAQELFAGCAPAWRGPFGRREPSYCPEGFVGGGATDRDFVGRGAPDGSEVLSGYATSSSVKRWHPE